MSSKEVLTFANNHRILSAGLALAAVVGIGYASSAPEEVTDTCTDLTHSQLVVTDSGNPLEQLRSVQDSRLHDSTLEALTDTFNRRLPWAVSASGVMTSNPGLFETNEDGSIADAKPGVYCLANPAPTVYGYARAQEGQSLADIATDNTTTVEQLVAYNPALADQDPDADLVEGSDVKISQAYDTNYVLRNSRGTLNQESAQTGVLPGDLVIHNVSTFAIGQTIDAGSAAFLPVISTPYTERHGFDPAAMVAAYQAQGLYEIPVTPAEPAATEAAPVVAQPDGAPIVTAAAVEYAEANNLPEIAQTISLDVVRQMLPDAKPGALEEMYPLVMRALAEQGIADEQMVLYAFATFSVEVAEGYPIEERWVDGRYKGRGYIQLTGETNYRQFGERLGLDLINYPELALVPENAARIAAAYLESRQVFMTRSGVDIGIRASLNQGDFIAARVMVNGRRSGLDPSDPEYNRPYAYNEMEHSYRIGYGAMRGLQAQA